MTIQIPRFTENEALGLLKIILALICRDEQTIYISKTKFSIFISDELLLSKEMDEQLIYKGKINIFKNYQYE